MKVWAVDGESTGDSTRYLLGIYSTEDMAKEALIKHNRDISPIHEPYIMEWEVDAPLEDY